MIYFLLSGIIGLIFRIKIVNPENEPDEGGFVVCANHISATDPIMLSYAFRNHQVCFMAKKELFKIPLLKQLITALGAFPVERGRADVGALKTAISMIKSGEAVTVFPQGTRYKGIDPKETKPKNGVGMIAYHTGAPVVPVYIRTKKHHVLPFRRTEIICGDVIMPEELGFEKGGSAEYSRAAEYIFEKICELGDTHMEEPKK